MFVNVCLSIWNDRVVLFFNAKSLTSKNTKKGNLVKVLMSKIGLFSYRPSVYLHLIPAVNNFFCFGNS